MAVQRLLDEVLHVLHGVLVGFLLICDRAVERLDNLHKLAWKYFFDMFFMKNAQL